MAAIPGLVATGRSLLLGNFFRAYAEKLSPMLVSPQRPGIGASADDVPELMRQSDILILPSIEEGSGLVTSRGTGSGCVLLASRPCAEFASI